MPLSYKDQWRRDRLRLAEAELSLPRQYVRYGRCHSVLIADNEKELRALHKTVDALHERGVLGRRGDRHVRDD